MKKIVGALLGLALSGCATMMGPPLGAGDWVLAKWRPDDPYFYPGVIATRSGDDVAIRYDDGDTATQRVINVHRFDWHAGLHVECKFTDGHYYGATITEMGADRFSMRIRYDDQTREETDSTKCRQR